MARIEGVNLPTNKRIEYAFTYLFGIGLKTSQDILNKLKIDFNKRVKDLTMLKLLKFRKKFPAIMSLKVNCVKKSRLNIKRLQEIGSYRGLRHKKGLPVRGQRTKTNARTRKGPRKAGSAIALKKKVTKK